MAAHFAIHVALLTFLFENRRRHLDHQQCIRLCTVFQNNKAVSYIIYCWNLYICYVIRSVFIPTSQMRDVYTGNNTRVYFGLYFRCSVLDLLCNLRFNYKDPWLNSDSILKFERDLELKVYLFKLVRSVTVNSLRRLCICLDLNTLNLNTW